MARPTGVPELGRWYAFEVMLLANMPGERDGRIALWLDGELIADPNGDGSRKLESWGAHRSAACSAVRPNFRVFENRPLAWIRRLARGGSNVDCCCAGPFAVSS